MAKSSQLLRVRFFSIFDYFSFDYIYMYITEAVLYYIFIISPPLDRVLLFG